MDIPVDAGSLSTVAELDANRFPKRDELVSWSAVGGILLLHQGGSGITAIDAFGDQRSRSGDDKRETSLQSAVIWEIDEGAVFPTPLGWQFTGDIDRVYFRPFAPAITSDHQFALFATPYGCAALRMATLPGRAVHPSTSLSILVSLSAQPRPEWTIAAAPVMIEHRLHTGESESAVGLLFAHRPSTKGNDGSVTTYYWKVVDLRAENPPLEIRTPLEPECRLPFNAKYCQVVVSPSRENTPLTGLVFATPNEIWVGTIQYEHRHEALNLTRVKSPPTNRETMSDDIRLAAEVESRNQFHWERFLVDAGGGAEEGSQLVIWLGHGGSGRDARYHLLSIAWPDSSASPTQKSEIEASVHTLGSESIVPVGVGPQGKAFFLKGAQGELFSHQHPNNSITEHSAFLRHIDQHIVGLTVLDPLVIAVTQRQPSTQGQACDFVSVRSLRTTNAPQREWGPFRLEADPIHWGGSLFICERDERRLVVRRIPLPAV